MNKFNKTHALWLPQSNAVATFTYIPAYVNGNQISEVSTLTLTDANNMLLTDNDLKIKAILEFIKLEHTYIGA